MKLSRFLVALLCALLGAHVVLAGCAVHDHRPGEVDASCHACGLYSTADLSHPVPLHQPSAQGWIELSIALPWHDVQLILALDARAPPR